MTNAPEDAFTSSAGLPSISFATKDQYGNKTSKPVGTRIGGRVLKVPTRIQGKDFDTKQPEFWPDGRPKMVAIVELEVDGVEMSLWAKDPGDLYNKILAAKERAHPRQPILPGAYLYVTLTGFAPQEGDKNPAKIYEVEYTPADSFASATPAPAHTNGSTPAATPTTPEGYTLDSLLAGGWTAQQIAAQYPQLLPAPPAAPPPPPPPVAIAPPPPLAPPAPIAPPPPITPPAPLAPPASEQNEREAAKAAAIAAMSPQDRALLGL